MDRDLPLHLRPRPPPRGRQDRLLARLHHLRLRRHRAAPQRADDALQRGPQARHAALGARRHLGRQERHGRAGRVRAARGRPVHRGRREAVHAVPGRAPQGQRDGLRRPARDAHPALRAAPGDAQGIPAPLALPPHRRVPGHQPHAVRPRQAPRRRTQEPLRGRRRRPEHLRLPRRRHPEHPLVPEGLLRGHHRPAGAELPEHPEDRPAGGRRDQGERQAARQEALDRQRRGRPGRPHGVAVGARRGAEDRADDPRHPLADGALVERRGRPLPDQRAVAVHRGGAPARRHPVPARRRDQLLPAQGDQGRAGLPPPRRQPDRRGLHPPRHQHAHARDRGQDHRRTPRLRHRAPRGAVAGRPGPAGGRPQRPRGEGRRGLRLPRLALRLEGADRPGRRAGARADPGDRPAPVLPRPEHAGGARAAGEHPRASERRRRVRRWRPDGRTAHAERVPPRSVARGRRGPPLGRREPRDAHDAPRLERAWSSRSSS